MEMENRFVESFVFEKLDVYRLSVEFYSKLRAVKFTKSDCDRILARQLYRAGLSVSLNIAEGVGKNSPKDKRNFFLIARGSLYECVGILNILKIHNLISESRHSESYSIAIRISKMLTALIKKMEKESILKK